MNTEEEFKIDPEKQYSFNVAKSINDVTSYTKLGKDLDEKEMCLLKGQWFRDKEETGFFVPWSYRGKVPVQDKMLIVLDGKEMEVFCEEFQFDSPHKLTYAEVLERLSGTKDLLRITGEFKMPGEKDKIY